VSNNSTYHLKETVGKLVI